MRELVECLQAWLADNRADGNAYALLVALAGETLKRADSADPAQREFDAEALAVAAEGPTGFEAAKRWIDRAKFEIFDAARRAEIEQHFRAAGFAQGLKVTRRSPGGKHRAHWFLEPYNLPDLEGPADPEERAVPVDELQSIQYDFTAAGEIRAAWYVKLLIGTGSFVTRSWRGLLWVTVSFLLPLAYLVVIILTGLGYTSFKRPVQTSDLASMLMLGTLGWAVWRLSIRPLVWLIDDRIIPATELWVAWNEENAQIELATDEDKRRRLQLVRYSAACPICAGKIELRYSQGPNRRRLVGCCSEAPHEHVFSFDRIRRMGSIIVDTMPANVR